MDRESGPRIAEGSILILISVVAALGNASLWFIICRSRDLRTVTNSFVLCLASADLLVSVTNMPITAWMMFEGKRALSETMCSVSGYLNMLTLVSSVMSLCNISISRYVMVCKPFLRKTLYTPKKTAAMITACWTVSALLSLPPFLGWGEYGYTWEQSFCFCLWPKSMSYAFFMIGACFGIPFTVMSICNILMFRAVRVSKRRVSLRSSGSKIPRVYSTPKPMTTTVPENSRPTTTDDTKQGTGIYEQEMSFDLSSASGTDTDNRKVTLRNKPKLRRQLSKSGLESEEVRLAAVLAIFVVVFVICWLPYCISMVISIFWANDVSPTFHIVTLLLGYFNSLCNPIIYGVMNKRLAEGFKQLFCCIFCRFTNSFAIRQSASSSTFVH